MFQIDQKSTKSIYEQIVDNIKALIMTDVLAEESKLPSVREMSKQLTINPNTVQKAFRELERQGYIYTVSGRGTFVSAKSDIRVDDARVDAAVGEVAEAFKQILFLGVGPDEAKSRCDKAIDDVIQSALNRRNSHDSVE